MNQEYKHIHSCMNEDKMDNIKSLGRLRYQIDWSKTCWYYINRKNEKINLRFFIGSVEFEDASINQIIIGPFMLSWGWKHD